MKTNITNYEQVRSELTTPCTAVRAINSYTTKFAVVQTAWRTQSFVVQNQTRPVSAKPYSLHICFFSLSKSKARYAKWSVI